MNELRNAYVHSFGQGVIVPNYAESVIKVNPKYLRLACSEIETSTIKHDFRKSTV